MKLRWTSGERVALPMHPTQAIGLLKSFRKVAERRFTKCGGANMHMRKRKDGDLVLRYEVVIRADEEKPSKGPSGPICQVNLTKNLTHRGGKRS